GVELNSDDLITGRRQRDMSRDEVHRSLRQMRTASQRDVGRLAAAGEVAASVHAEKERTIESGELFIFGGEDEVRVRLYHPSDILLLRELQVAGGKSEIAVGFRYGRCRERERDA